MSLKEKLNDADEMTCTGGSRELDWQAGELDSDGKSLALS